MAISAWLAGVYLDERGAELIDPWPVAGGER
jgi:hypothetical protein